MAASYVVGDLLATAEEMEEKALLGEFTRFENESSRGKSAEVRLFSGTVKSDDIKRPDFAPIGLGKPLTVEIVTVYTGDVPSKFLGFLTGAPSLLVTSGAKILSDTSAAPRAINQLVTGIGDFQHLEPSAFAQGSPIVYHTPAVVQATTLTSYELVVDSFDDQLSESISTLFVGAAGLPVFAPASAILLAGSAVVKMFGKLAKALLESEPFLKSSLNMHLDSPEIRVTQPSHIVLYNKNDEKHFAGYKAVPVHLPSGQEQMRLVDSVSGQEHEGTAPYVIARLDGREKPGLEKYSPLHASASLLDNFYRADAAANSIDVLGEALSLYNDMKFRTRAEEMRQKLDALPADSPEKEKAQLLFEAYKKNISSELLKIS